MSGHVRGVRISRSSNYLLAVAFAVVAFASLGLMWIARLAPGAPRSASTSEVAPIVAPSRSSAPQCLPCGTVLIIRTFELRDETTGEAAQRRFVYRVTLQMDDGSFRTFSQSAQPPFRVGARVRVLNGAISART